jgi:anti-sigma regulatory factor (Ser/Thr protein kinase)
MDTCDTALRLPADAASVRRARGWLGGLRLNGLRLGDLQMVVSELVTNALLHVSPDARDGDIELWGAETPTGLRVEVIDHGPGFTPARPCVPPRGQVTGRGLLVVDRLVDRWGVRRDPAGVWFEMDRDGA